MIDSPLVSICCITYNHEKYIGDAIEGFLMQETDFPIEIIIHDDASFDDTPKIIKKYEEKFPSLIKPIYQRENQYSKGIRPSPNYVWPQARGKYLALCEGDDYWSDPLKLQKQVEFLEKNNSFNMCVHGTSILNNEEIIKMEWRWDSKRTEFNLNDYIYKHFFHTSSVMIRSNCVPKKFPKNILSGDFFAFSHSIGLGKVKYIDEVMSIYRKHDDGITNTATHNDKELINKSNLIITKSIKNLVKNNIYVNLKLSILHMNKFIYMYPIINYPVIFLRKILKLIMLIILTIDNFRLK